MGSVNVLQKFRQIDEILENLFKLLGGGDYYSVKRFGAKGDGKTDDSAAIQRAFDAGLSKIHFPEGIYMVSKNIMVPSNFALTGDGALLSTIRLIPNAGNVDMLMSKDTENITLKGITIDGNRDKQDNRLAHTTCLQFHRSHNLVIDDVRVIGSLIEGVYLYDSRDFQLRNLYCKDNGHPQEDASGVHIDNCTGGYISNLIACYNGFHGLLVGSSSKCTFASIITHGNGVDGIRIQWESRFNTFTGVQSYNNFRGIYLGSWSSANQIVDSTFTGNLTNGIVANTVPGGNMLHDVISAENPEYGLYLANPGDVVFGDGVAFQGNKEGSIYLEEETYFEPIGHYLEF